MAGVSDLEMREIGVRALRQVVRARAPGSLGADQVTLNGDLCGGVLSSLAKRKGWPTIQDPVGFKELLCKSLNDPLAASVAEFVIWFVRAGLAWPLGAPQNALPITLKLTRSGERFLRLADDHPLLPGFLERLATRCPAISEDALSLIADARACLDHGLMRPAVVLLGVAYEVTVEHVFEALVSKGVLSDTGQKAAARITALRGKIDDLILGKSQSAIDDRGASHRALDFADALRRRRNDASHTAPTYGFEDREEVEELIVSAGRHLPNLWRLRA
ncbi:MAG TPA: hypothetical protein VGY54_26740 [Polyangiaceae bacterium]|nr:hypothetical protein [Polyangiaceae bacterium]